MNEIFSFKEPSYHFRNDTIFVRNNDRTMTYGTKTIYLLGSNLTPGTVYQENKKLNHYINLKKKKSNWETDGSHCGLCKTRRVGFIWSRYYILFYTNMHKLLMTFILRVIFFKNFLFVYYVTKTKIRENTRFYPV